MGFNSVVVVMNDALGMIEEDPTFGRNLAQEVMTYRRTGGDVPAYSPTGMGSTVTPHLYSVASTQMFRKLWS